MTWNFIIVCRQIFFCKYSLKSIKIPFFFLLLSNICVQFFSRTLRRTNDRPFIDRITKLIKCLNFAQPNGKGKSRTNVVVSLRGSTMGVQNASHLDLLLIFPFRSTPAKVGCNFKLLALHQRILLWTVNTETPPMTSYSSFSRGEDRSLLETYRSALETDRIIYRNRAFRLWSSFRTRHSPSRWNSLKGTEDVYTCLRNCFSSIFRRDNVELNSQRIYGIHFLEDVFARVA